MRRFISTRSASTVGVDIRLNGIRLIHLQHVTRKKHCLMAIEIIDFPQEIVVDGKIKAPDKLTQNLRELVQQTKTQCYSACIALPAQAVITKHIRLSKTLTSAQRMKEIEDNIAHYFPDFSRELCYDYALTTEKTDLHHSVVWVAARQEQLNDYINVVQEAGLVVKVVDVDCYALARAARFLIKESVAKELIALLEVSADSVLFVVLHQQQVTYHLQWDYKDIHDIYIKLQTTMQWYSSTHFDAQFNLLYLAGDRKQTEMIQSDILNKMSVTLRPKFFPYDKNSLLEKMIVCYGLALRNMPVW